MRPSKLCSSWVPLGHVTITATGYCTMRARTRGPLGHYLSFWSVQMQAAEERAAVSEGYVAKLEAALDSQRAKAEEAMAMQQQLTEMVQTVLAQRQEADQALEEASTGEVAPLIRAGGALNH